MIWNVLIFFIVFTIFVGAFSIGLHILLANTYTWRNWGYAILALFRMMVGYARYSIKHLTTITATLPGKK